MKNSLPIVLRPSSNQDVPASSCKAISKCYHNRVPRKIRQLVKDLEKAGFEFLPGKGSHRKFYHPKAGMIVISGQLGDDARRYQEREVAEAMQKAKL
jgi:predicted RNA binding protein YcfA (HicA-like mRNA interferase family)